MKAEGLRGDDAPQREERIAAVIVGGEAVLYDPDEKDLSSLNATGALIWQLCDGSATIDELIDELSAGFGTGSDLIRADVEAVLSQLRDRGFIRVW